MIFASEPLISSGWNFHLYQDNIDYNWKKAWYRVELNDRKTVREMLGQTEAWMKAVGNTNLLGIVKVLGYKHGVLLRLLWLLLMYEVPLSMVKTLENRINSSLRRRLSTPKSFASISLHRFGSKPQLSITSAAEEYEVSKGSIGRHHHPNRIQVVGKKGFGRGRGDSMPCRHRGKSQPRQTGS